LAILLCWTGLVAGQGETSRCGANYTDAASKCGIICQYPENCPPGQQCYANLPVAPEPCGPDFSRRGGHNLTEATQSCAIPCFHNPLFGDCPADQTCFTNLNPAPCLPSPSPAAFLSRCGVNYNLAASSCGTLCNYPEDCPAGQGCFANLPLTPCGGGLPSPSPETDVTSRCGVNYNTADTTCGTFCKYPEECPAGQQCFANLQTTPCNAQTKKQQNPVAMQQSNGIQSQAPNGIPPVFVVLIPAVALTIVLLAVGAAFYYRQNKKALAMQPCESQELEAL